MIKKTHKQSILQAMKHTKLEMCKLLKYSEDAYDIMRYELAIVWLEYNDFYEATARIHVLSKSFFKWWYQQLNGCERIFIDHKIAGLPESQRQDKFFEFVLSMEFRPSSPVYDNIRKEGCAAIEANPNLKKLKIYDDKTRTKNSTAQGDKAA
jgi:hypothetical protein